MVFLYTPLSCLWNRLQLSLAVTQHADDSTDMELGMRSKCLGSAILVFIILHTAAADEDFELCREINCWKGTCNVSSSDKYLGFVPGCECDPGWQQPSNDFPVTLSFLPCVIPNCKFKADCGGKAPSSAPSPVYPPSSNFSFGHLNPCQFGISLCGEGSCVAESEFGYRCHCNEGYQNLFNMTASPCLKPCKELPSILGFIFIFQRSPVRIPCLFPPFFAGSIGADCSQFRSNGSRTAAPQSQQAPPQSETDTSKGFMEDIPFLITMTMALSISFILFLLG